MELYKKDPALTKAMALALMRQALGLVHAVNESTAGCHLQMAIDELTAKQPPEEAGDATH